MLANISLVMPLRKIQLALVGLTCLVVPAFFAAREASAEEAKKPNIVLLVSDDMGWGDLGAYGGGEGRGQPTPNFDRIAEEGMTFFSFYGQPSCTLGRVALVHEQLHRTYLDLGDVQRGNQGSDEDLRQVSASQGAERNLHWPDYSFSVRKVPIHTRQTRKRRDQYPPSVHSFHAVNHHGPTT